MSSLSAHIDNVKYLYIAHNAHRSLQPGYVMEQCTQVHSCRIINFLHIFARTNSGLRYALHFQIIMAIFEIDEMPVTEDWLSAVAIWSISPP